MAEHDCSNFTIKNDYDSEVSSQMDSLRELANIITPHGTFFELEWSIGKSVDHKVEDLEELDVYGTEHSQQQWLEWAGALDVPSE